MRRPAPLGALAVLALAALHRVTHAAYFGAAVRADLFSDGRPVLLAHDGYRYLSQAATAPTASILAALGAATRALTGWSLDWCGVLLPALLGGLPGVAVLTAARRVGLSTPYAVGAGLAATAAPMAFFRSELGYFDTDPLIAALLIAGAAALDGWLTAAPDRRGGWFAAAAVLAALLLATWDSGPDAAFVLLAGGMVFTGLADRGDAPSRRRHGAAAALALGALAALPRTRAAIFSPLIDRLRALATPPPPGLPDLRGLVAELRPPDPTAFGHLAIGHPLTLALALCGGALLTYRLGRRRPPIPALFWLTFVLTTRAERFLGLFGPLAALGAASALHSASTRHPKAPLPCALIGALAIAAALAFIRPRYQPPAVPASVFAGFEAVRLHTPEDAVVWGPWPFGYALEYYTGRRAGRTGEFVDTLDLLRADLPYLANNDRLAANSLAFLTRRPRDVIHRVLGAPDRSRPLVALLGEGPAAAVAAWHRWAAIPDLNCDDWLRTLYAPGPRPIYLLAPRDGLWLTTRGLARAHAVPYPPPNSTLGRLARGATDPRYLEVVAATPEMTLLRAAPEVLSEGCGSFEGTAPAPRPAASPGGTDPSG